MPNNMEHRGLTNREMVQLCLELEKNRLRSITNTLMETTHDELENIYRRGFEVTMENQKTMFDILHSRGWYDTKDASQEQIGKVQGLMQKNLHPDQLYPDEQYK